MRKVATAFMGADGKRIYAEVTESEYQRILQQLEAEDWDGFAKMEFEDDDGNKTVGLLMPADEFLNAWKKLETPEPEGAV